MKGMWACLIGGALGAICRYGLSGLIGQRLGVFPWGTAAVNLLGCFLIGIGWCLAERWALPSWSRMGFFIGFLGAFTTFSTYALETFHLIRDNELKLALVNLMLNNIGGVMLVIFGYTLTVVFFR